MIKNLEQYPIVREIQYFKDDMIKFEDKIVEYWEAGKIKGPVHLSGGNEDELIEIGKRIKPNDWIFSTWRSHYHALIKGISPDWIEKEILEGRSITLINKSEKFYASAIVGSILSVSVGVALSNKMSKNDEVVWCFIGDMAFESGIFYEMHKYATNYKLPIRFIIEDNNMSTNTPTIETWGGTKRDIPSDVIWYNYKNKWPHYGTGKWVTF